jgi:diguanylate cyclase (GGDEF)-like protein
MGRGYRGGKRWSSRRLRLSFAERILLQGFLSGANMSDPLRVLIVQADDSERLFQRALFGDAGLSVIEAATGAEALDYLATDRPDLVVLGRALPDMDGLELLPRLKSSELDFVPVLVASQRGETSERVRGLQLGADDYLARPCDPAELLARAKALLRSKTVHDKVRKLQVALEQMVVSDPLTGLHNRRYLMDRLVQEMQRADRHGEPLAFAMIDLDGFKPINDQFGHVVGDKVLRAVGGAVSKCVRVSDIAARYGGDEFAVILPQTPPDGAMRVCERIVRSISELQLQDERGAACKVTASLGLAYYPADDVETPEDLVHSADGALYGAKRSGKNRFTAVRSNQPHATA